MSSAAPHTAHTRLGRLTRIALADCRPQPWKNGGGSTRELLTWPPGAAAQAWSLRLSLATIDRDGPFSPFAGVMRYFAVVEGGGVGLSWPTGGRHVHLGDRPVVFDGADAPHARLLGGPTLDLNLMLRQGTGQGSLELALPGRPWDDASPWRAFYAARAVNLRVDDQPAVPLPAHTLAFCADALPGPWRAESAEKSAAPQVLGWWMAWRPPLNGTPKRSVSGEPT